MGGSQRFVSFLCHGVANSLETLNLGRLRIASKGIARDGDTLRRVHDTEVREEGMFMIGDVATLHDEVNRLFDFSYPSRDTGLFSGWSPALAGLTARVS